MFESKLLSKSKTSMCSQCKQIEGLRQRTE